MIEGLALDQGSALFEYRDDLIIGLVYMLAGKEFGSGNEQPIRPDRVFKWQVIFHARREVFVTMPGRGMHGSGTSFKRDVVTHNDWHLAIIKRMTQHQTF